MPVDAAKPLIVCADDFALSEGVSSAVEQLGRAGRISATSAMVLSPRWAADAPRLADLRGQIGVGLHLDWTSPLAVAAGHGMSLPRAMAASVAGGFKADRVSAVIERQLDAFEAHWNAAPDHVDGHQHVHQFAGIRAALLDILDRRYGGGAGPWLRISRPVGAGSGLKGRVIGAMGARALQDECNARQRPSSPVLTGLYDFAGTPSAYAARVAAWLRDAPAGAVLMCHPGTHADADDAISLARLREFAFWRSDSAGNALARANVTLTRGPGRPRAAP